MKYFRLRAYTPYCGEELTAVAKGESEHEVLASGLPDDLMADCASEWFDPADYETFGYEDEEEYEEMYYQECGCEITEIVWNEETDELEFYAGNMYDDKYAEQVFPNEIEMDLIYQYVVENFQYERKMY